MRIPQAEQTYRKALGYLGTRRVYGIGTVGGLHVVVAADGEGGFETLGAGSHPAVARHTARLREPSLAFDGLAKSEHVDEAHFRDQVPAALALVAALRRAQNLPE